MINQELLNKGIRASMLETARQEGMDGPFTDEQLDTAGVIADMYGGHVSDDVLAIIKAVAADLWREGYTSGHSNAMRMMSDEPNVQPTANPYVMIGEFDD